MHALLLILLIIHLSITDAAPVKIEFTTTPSRLGPHRQKQDFESIDFNELNHKLLMDQKIHKSYIHFMDTFDPKRPINQIPAYLKRFPDIKRLKSSYETFKINYLRELPDRETVQLPIHIMFDSSKGKKYFLSKEIGHDDFSRSFDAQMKGSGSGVSVVFKVYRRSASHSISKFNREVEVLRELDRLVDFDPGNMIIVETKIEGPTLRDFLNSEEGFQAWNAPNSKLLKKYNDLNLQFNRLTKNKFYHGDIRPANVIMKPDGGMALTHFGSAISLHGLTEKQRINALFDDISKSDAALKLDLNVIRKSYGRSIFISKYRVNVNE